MLAKNRRWEEVYIILELHAQKYPDLVNSRGPNGDRYSCMMHAAEAGAIDVLVELGRRGGDPVAGDQSKTAFHVQHAAVRRAETLDRIMDDRAKAEYVASMASTGSSAAQVQK